MKYLLLACAACSFHAQAAPGDGAPADVPGDSPVDAPPATPDVHFTSVTSSAAALQPGLYGIAVDAVLQNDLDTPITDVQANLGFGGGRGAQFYYRDVDRRDGATAMPQPTMVAAHASATFHFIVDAQSNCVPPGPVPVNGIATFFDGTATLSATPLATPLSLPFVALNAPIVVDTATDENTANATTSLREAIALANTQPGLDRITFDPTLATATIMLDRTLGQLPTISSDLVIDGNGVMLRVDQTWQTMPGLYGIKITGGTVVISGLKFKGMAYNYKLEDVSTNNCGLGDVSDGGAILITGGTLILDGNRFDDAGVPEKNCYAAALRIEGGTGHRIVRNSFAAEVMDTMNISANVREVSDNTMSSSADPTAGDDGIFVSSQGNSELWITGNTFVDKEYDGVYAGGGDAGDLYLINNTFVRTGLVANGAVGRSNARTIHSRNNIFLDDSPAGFVANNAGALFDIAYDEAFGNPLCSGCTTVTPTNILTTDPMLDTNLAPGAGSPAIDSGEDWLDRNGKKPGHTNGSGADRGATETP